MANPATRIDPVGVYLWQSSLSSYQFASHLVVDEIVEAVSPEISHATIRARLGSDDGTQILRAEAATPQEPQRAELRILNDGNPTTTTLLMRVILFPGPITLDAGGESAVWLAKDLDSWRLAHNIPLRHQALGYDGTAKWFSGLSPVFNPLVEGQVRPNAVSAGGTDYCFGDWSDSAATLWTLGTAIDYLRRHYEAELDAALPSDLLWPSTSPAVWPHMAQKLRDVPLDGLSYWDILCRVTRECGCRMAIRHGDVQQIDIWPIGDGDQKTVLLQSPGQQYDPTASNACRISVQRDYSGVVSNPLIVAGRVEVEDTFALVAGWDSDDLAAAPEPPDYRPDADDPEALAEWLSHPYVKRFTSRGSEFYDYRNVGRIWILNETGLAEDETPVNPTAYVISGSQSDALCARLPRRFTPPLARERGELTRKAPLVEIRIDAGAWQPLEGVEVLSTFAALRIEANDLRDVLLLDAAGDAISYWDAITDSEVTVEVQITAALITDDREYSNPTAVTALPCRTQYWYDRRSSMPSYRQMATSRLAVVGEEIIVSPGDDGLLGTEEAVLGPLCSTPRVSGSILMPGLVSGYSLGDSITGVVGRTISFAVTSGATTRFAEIVSIVRQLRSGQTTELVLGDPLSASSGGS